VLRLCLIGAVLCCSPAVMALEGKVVAVLDGDTIEVLDSSKRLHRVRFDGIDAPERGQPFGNRAKSTLSDLVFGRDVRIDTKGPDKYDRTIGRVHVDGRDVGLAMLEAGVAWHYTKYDQSREYAAGEKSAKDAGRGLWADRNPVPPWEWRKLSKAERDKRRVPQGTR
jgi:endonuclease YncB( thermonuclease family)